ncbi:MAG: hypothetical protein EXR72_25660 [Myxococcales bacterium]|nr:hypothetical protein [Myxococcales bacterium]
MGIGKRLLDLARANLNALLDQAAGDARVEELSDDELEAELVRRRERKVREEAARMGASAAERAARARGAAQRTAAPPRSDERTRAEQARRASPPPPPPPRKPPPTADQRLAQLYAALETPVGADFATVKKNFRRLMRKYHPDLNAGSPEKLKAATERSSRITTAYTELERLLAR